MSCCDIANAEIVNCGCGSSDCCCALTSAGQAGRPMKSQIVAYAPLDPLPDYIIDFNMTNGTSQIWTYTTAAARDAVLVNVDIEMCAKTM